MERPNTLRVNVTVEIYSESGYSGPLRLSEQFNMPECDFSSMAEIMKRLHDLMEEIKKQRTPQRK